MDGAGCCEVEKLKHSPYFLSTTNKHADNDDGGDGGDEGDGYLEDYKYFLGIHRLLASL